MTAKGRFPNGSPEWIRLGKLLEGRRGELDADYAGSMTGHGGRKAFAAGRGINQVYAEDLELNRRENFTPRMLRDVVAPAYGVTYESIRAVLDGSGDLVAAPGTAPRRQPGGQRSRPPEPVPPEAAWKPDARPGAGFSAAEVVAAEPLKDAIREHFDALVAGGDPDPDGAAMFPGSLPLAAAWDAARLGSDPEQAVWAVALIQLRMGAAAGDRAPRRGSAGALAPG